MENYKIDEYVDSALDETAEDIMPYPNARFTLVKIGKAIHVVTIMVAVLAIVAGIVATNSEGGPYFICGIIIALLIYIPGLAVMTFFKVIANIAYCQREALRKDD